MNDNLLLGPDRILAPPGEDALELQASLDKLQRVEWIESLVAPGGWEVMCTFSFRWEASIESARRCFTRWIDRTLPRVSYFYAVEVHPGGHGAHVHSLWADATTVNRTAAWSDVFQRWGRARIEPVRSKQDSSDYASKYLCKAEAWYDIRLQWHRLHKLRGAVFTLEPAGLGGQGCVAHPSPVSVLTVPPSSESLPDSLPASPGGGGQPARWREVRPGFFVNADYVD